MTIRLALPTGDTRSAVASMFEAAGITAPGYAPGSRLLRSQVEGEDIAVRIFREKDIPVQVALGNYDLGICGDLWIMESQVRFPLQHVTRVGGFALGESEVWLAAAPESGLRPGEAPSGAGAHGLRIATELPNLGDALAAHLRIPGYRLIALWGSADAYPPEDADLALLPAGDADDVEQRGLVPLHRLLESRLALVANANSLTSSDLSPVLKRLGPLLTGFPPELVYPPISPDCQLAVFERDRSIVRLALADGHQQPHTVAALRDAGFEFEGYGDGGWQRRPSTGIAGLEAKVVRPQDMTQLVAIGMFDIAITGRDWLTDHLCRFPGSPVEMAVDLGRSRYRIGPVVDAAFPAETTEQALRYWVELDRPVRIASEYPALAERFARDHHLHYTAIIPINGASEGFVPEDADILIEGTETGTSIRANGLKMLDPFMESTNCVIVRRDPVTRDTALLRQVVEKLAASVGAAV
jgi:ATP phosphoribosyltransferase